MCCNSSCPICAEQLCEHQLACKVDSVASRRSSTSTAGSAGSTCSRMKVHSCCRSCRPRGEGPKPQLWASSFPEQRLKYQHCSSRQAPGCMLNADSPVAQVTHPDRCYGLASQKAPLQTTVNPKHSMAGHRLFQHHAEHLHSRQLPSPDFQMAHSSALCSARPGECQSLQCITKKVCHLH